MQKLRIKGYISALNLCIALPMMAACALTNDEPRSSGKVADRGGQSNIVKPSIRPAGHLHVSAPSWKKGENWQYSDGYGLHVKDVNGNITTFQRTDDPEQWFSRYGFLREEAQSRDAFRKVVYRSVPPSRGLKLSANNGLVFTREYLVNKQLRVHRTSWVLEGKETITVPAGQFNCIVIVMRTRSLRTGWKGFERWWYSPKLKHYARIEYKYGASQILSRVLVSYNTMNKP